MTKASELADELIECTMEELCHHSQEAAALLRKQEAVIRQMRDALDHMCRNTVAEESYNAALVMKARAAADEVLK